VRGDRSSLKRLLDVAAAIVLLVTMLPLMGLIAIVIGVTSRGPILFSQLRVGRYGKVFRIYKFRTMREPSPGEDRLTTDGRRLTSLGVFLRRTSLDELPQLYNVLRGELSLVGPRPLLVDYYPYFTAREQLRHSVPAGITGWAQLNGRNTLTWDARLEADVWYVENWSLCLDLKILWLTALRVATGTGVTVDARSSFPNLDEERRGRGTDRLPVSN
jgi:lipopolysaccharide/colanic/teichoic acid biosynthesis glycosyltransferase